MTGTEREMRDTINCGSDFSGAFEPLTSGRTETPRFAPLKQIDTYHLKKEEKNIWDIT